MQIRPLAILGGLLLTLPAVFAHPDAGLPKNYCEAPSEWTVHDYGPLSTGVAILGWRDGNAVADCNNDADLPDYDGHHDWAESGAGLLVASGDGVSGGSIACYGGEGHHPEFGPFTVTDNLLGVTIPFTVAVDTFTVLPPTEPGPTCGDFQDDLAATCVGTCSVPFPSGLDGAYRVYVGNANSPSVTGGHVETLGIGGSTPLDHPGQIIITRLIGGSYSFSGSAGLSCLDMVSGTPVAPPSAIAGPNPKVRCVISSPGTAVCDNVAAGGGPSIGVGTILVTSSCLGGTTVTASHVLGGPPVVASSSLPHGYVPWTCAVNDAGTAGLVTYSATCLMNA